MADRTLKSDYKGESVAQSKSTRSDLESQSSAQSSVVTKWTGDHYVLDFVPTLIFLQSDSVQTLQKSFE